MKLGDVDLDEIYTEATGKHAGSASRLAKVLAAYGQVQSEEGKSAEQVAAIRSLKKLVPSSIIVSIIAVTIVLVSIIYTVWQTIHGASGGGMPFIVGAFVVAIALLGGFFAIARRTFGKDWYTFRDSIL